MNLQSLDENGTPPARRIAKASDAYDIFQRQWQRYQDIKGPLNAKVQGAIDGNPPVSQAKLDAEGLGWTSNCNFRMLEADVSQAAIPLYSLFSDVPTYIQVGVEVPKVPKNDNRRFGEIIAEEHRRLMRKWPFDFQMQLGIANRCRSAIGCGNLYFSDKRDFRFQAAPQGTVFVPDEATQDLDKLPLLSIYYEWQVTELYNAINNPRASEIGWNVESVKQALINRLNQSSGFRRNSSWEYWQTKIRDHDAWLSQTVPTVNTAWVYVKEYNGKISRSLIFADQMGKENYLFDKKDEFDAWEEIIHPFFAEIGNGNWNGTKSIAVKAFNFRAQQNRLKNKMLDAAFIGSQVLFQAEDAAAAEAFQMLQLGPGAVIDKKITPMQMPLLSQLDKPMAIDNALERTLQNNIGGIRSGMMDMAGKQPVSATEAQITAAGSQSLTIAEQTRWLEQLDALYTEQMRRLAVKPRAPTEEAPHDKCEELAYEFHKRCEDRGVPNKAFSHIVDVRATRTIGRGSEMFKQQLSQQIYSLLRSDPNVPKGVLVRHLRHTVSNLTGRDYLETIWPEDEIEVSPTNDESKAQDENAGMLLGVPPIMTPEQNPLSHAVTHLQFLASKYVELQQGGNPQAYLTLAGVSLAHIAETLDSMTGDEVKGSMKQQLFNAYEQLVAQTKQVAQQFQEMQQAQAEQQQQQQLMEQQAMLTGQLMDPASKLEMAKIQADTQLRAMKQDGDLKLKAKKQEATQRLKNAQVAQQIGIKDLQTAQDLRIKQRQSAG